MKILVPTDFSDLSKTALEYAAKIANQLNAELLLLYVLYIDNSTQTQIAWHMKDLEDDMIETAKRECSFLAKQLQDELGAPSVSYQIAKGYPMHTIIEQFAIQNQIDLIIMGTKGATGLKKVFLGSNAAAIISHSHFPVMVIPENAKYDGIHKIVYASDNENIESELKKLIGIAKQFKATIHFVHIMSPDSDKLIDTALMEADLKNKFNYPLIICKVKYDQDVLNGLESYVKEQNAEIIAMFTYKKSLAEKLLGKSITRQMAFNAKIPILSFNNEE